METLHLQGEPYTVCPYSKLKAQCTSRNPDSLLSLAIWAFIMDSCFSIMFNSCPLLSLTELQFDFSYHEDLFEAETASMYEQLVSSADPSIPRKATAQIFQSLFEDIESRFNGAYVTPTHLGLIICGTYLIQNLETSQVEDSNSKLAVQSQTMAARHWNLLPATSTLILRAADRWEELWRSAISCRTPGDPPLRGFTNMNVDLCHFVRMIVRAGGTETPGCRYTRLEATDDIRDLNDFLRIFSRE
jgi:hypothetical protein